MRSRSARPLDDMISSLAVIALVIGLVGAPATRANAASCAQLTLTLVMDWPADVGVTARWGNYGGELRHPSDNTTPPFIYSGDVVVPLSSYAASWSYRIKVGSQAVFDSGPSWEVVSLGDGQCSDTLIVQKAAGDVTVRAFMDPTGSGDVSPFDAPFYEGMADVPIHICLLPLTGRGCVPGSEALFGSPAVTTADTDFTVGWGSLRGRFKVWADAPERYLRTYPTIASTVLDCGGASNVCAASQGHWILDLRYGGSVWLDLGLVGPVRNEASLIAR